MKTKTIIGWAQVKKETGRIQKYWENTHFQVYPRKPKSKLSKGYEWRKVKIGSKEN